MGEPEKLLNSLMANPTLPILQTKSTLSMLNYSTKMFFPTTIYFLSWQFVYDKIVMLKLLVSIFYFLRLLAGFHLFPFVITGVYCAFYLLVNLLYTTKHQKVVRIIYIFIHPILFALLFFWCVKKILGCALFYKYIRLYNI